MRNTAASSTTDRSRAFTFALCVMATLGALLLCTVLTAAAAEARVVHVFGSTFGSEGSAAGQFKDPSGIAVNDATGDVYVVDRGNDRVEEFDSTGSTLIGEFNGSSAPTGAFSEPTEIAVDNSGSPLDPSNEDVYVVDRAHGVIDKFGPTGVYLGQVTGTPVCTEKNPCKSGGPFEVGASPRAIQGVAIDPSGNLWVSTAHGPIYSFSDALVNQYSSERETVFAGADEGLAVDSEDNLYLREGSPIVKVDSSGKVLLKNLVNGSGQTVHPFGGEVEGSDSFQKGFAVDSSNGEVFIGRTERENTNTQATVGAFSLEAAPFERFGSGYLTFVYGVAVNQESGVVYATDLEADRVAVFDAIPLPTVAAGALSEQQPRSVTLNGTVNPEGLPVTSCEFEYVAADEYEPGASNPYAKGAKVLCSPASPGSGASPVAVSAQLSGLAPEASYRYRLVAANSFGSEPSGDQEFFTGPKLGAESANDVTSSSVTLQAPLDPNGGDTHYYFQYGPTTAYGGEAPISAPGVDIGSLVGGQPISLHLQGLAASTIYHYQIVVSQGGEVFAEPDRTFTTQAAGGGFSLPDGRLWELVSPASKKGALIEPNPGEQPDQIQAADDGSAITYLTMGPSPAEDPQGKITWAQILSRRGSAGWSSEDLTLPATLPENGESATKLTIVTPEYRLFSPDLSLAVVEPQAFGTPLLATGITARTLYLRDDENGSFLPLVTPANVPSGTYIEEPSFGESEPKFWEMHFLMSTPDLSHVLFKTPLALTPEAIDEEKAENNPKSEPQSNLYEWGNNKLQLVNILPNGEATSGPVPPGVTLAGELGDGEGNVQGGAQRAVSSNGRRVAWTWGQTATTDFKGLFVRDMIEERTVQIGGPRAEYQTMNSEGSKIFFIENGDLYEFDFETAEQVDLTGVHGPGESSAGVQPAVSDVSEDGSYVYFVANGVLAPGAVPGTCSENAKVGNGRCNLYLLHFDRSEWEAPRLIAVLSQEDRPSWFAEAYDGTTGLGHVSSRVSPNGRYLAFMSERSLTGYDNTDAVSGQPDEEVYLYDAVAGKLVCVSCNPTGARPVGVLDTTGTLLVDRQNAWTATGGTGGDTDHWLAGSVPGWDASFTSASYQPRYLSDNGRVFFDSPDALVPQDSNGLEDVYEYEPPGVGGCTATGVTFSERSGGCVDLISSGTSGSESAFLDASESGDDAFFVTAAQLSAADRDTSLDVYDAHACSASVPCGASPVSSPACETGDACRAAPAPQPSIFGDPASATFSGVGNVPPSAGVPIVKKSLTRAQKLARALSACKKDASHGQRRRCEGAARKQYRTKGKSKSKSKSRKGAK